MKRFLALAALMTLTATSAMADDVRIPAAMQRCASNEECIMVPGSCGSSCATLPVNKSQLSAAQAIYAKQCGKAADANGTCASAQTLEPACVSNHCTIASLPVGAGDYKPGAYPIPEAPTPMPSGSENFDNVNDRDGHFSAYDLPPELVKQNMMGQYNFPAQ